MKTRFAKKIWNRRVDRYSPYWYCQVWDYIAKLNRDHRIDKAKRIYLKQYERRNINQGTGLTSRAGLAEQGAGQH